jgi:hypothetical protein
MNSIFHYYKRDQEQEKIHPPLAKRMKSYSSFEMVESIHKVWAQ